MSAIQSPAPAVYSADVRLVLRVGGLTIPLSQIAPDFIILSHPQPLLAGAAEVVMTVDGRERVWSIELPQGSPPTPGRTSIRRL